MILKFLGCCVVGLISVVNLLLWRQARALTHFRRCGVRPKRPEEMSGWEKMAIFLSGRPNPRPEIHQTPANFGLSFIARSFTNRRGDLLRAWEIPGANEREWIILFHGYLGAKDSLLQSAREFHSLGPNLLLVDFFGYGESDGCGTTIGYREADDVSGAIRFISQRNPGARILLYGQSMGAAAILRALFLAPVEGVLGIVLECPFNRLLTTLGHRFELLGLPAFPLAHLLLFYGGLQGGFSGFSHNPEDYVTAVRLPLLLLHGEKDRRVTVPEVSAIARNHPGWSRVIVLPDTGHENYLDRQPETWREAIREFFIKINFLKSQ